ncbi:MAG TPA: hypothetical protein VL981_04615 [Candidatus Methylacidiphilales bacterium]|nr:hypothetical protein [Candidatus Methylacidiphilales bacterium]
MSRNRLRHGHSLHWMGVLKWILIVGLLSILGLVYMLGKNQNLHLAQETYRLQEQLDAINLRNDQLNFDLNRMKSPAALVRRLAQMHSTLVRLDQMAANVVPMDQSGTRMRLERIGTIPNSGLNPFNPPVASTSETAAASPPANQ